MKQDSTWDIVFFSLHFVLILKWERWPSQYKRKSKYQFSWYSKIYKICNPFMVYGFIFFQWQRKYNQRAYDKNWIIYFQTLHYMKMLVFCLMNKLINKTISSSNLVTCFCSHVDKTQYFMHAMWKSYLKSLKNDGGICSFKC